MSKTLELTPEFKAYLDRVNEAIPSMLPQCKENIEGSKKNPSRIYGRIKSQKEWMKAEPIYWISSYIFI